MYNRTLFLKIHIFSFFANNIIKFDLHIHSYASKYKEAQGIVDCSTIENLPILFSKLNENNIALFSITDHNRFDADLYIEAQRILAERKYPNVKNILAGVEFDVQLESEKAKCHIIAIFDTKNKDDLLENQIKLEVNIDNLNVYTDKKWLEFILNQIVNNSIKYKKNNNSFINITAHEEKDKIILSVYDNGIGIPSKDIKRVFDKSFTGTNGRDKVKSTGMGLYIIKNLCNKLGHNIYIKSEENKYTNVVIEFGKNKYYKF